MHNMLTWADCLLGEWFGQARIYSRLKWVVSAFLWTSIMARMRNIIVPSFCVYNTDYCC
jgi:hypothetical protein